MSNNYVKSSMCFGQRSIEGREEKIHMITALKKLQRKYLELQQRENNRLPEAEKGHLGVKEQSAGGPGKLEVS